MKKYFLGITALALVFGATVLNQLNAEAATAKQTGLYWYYKNPLTGSYSFVGQNTTPPAGVSCPEGEDEICLKAFNASQDASMITDSTPSQQTTTRASN